MPKILLLNGYVNKHKTVVLPLQSDIIYFIDHYCAGVSNKHCFLHFFHFSYIHVDSTITLLPKSKNSSL